MSLKHVAIKNFRLLADTSVSVEPETTVIVGRNNTGKTSLSEIFRRSFATSSGFKLEDFSPSAHDLLLRAYAVYAAEADEEAAKGLLPSIELNLTIDYTEQTEKLGSLADCIIDLDPDSQVVKLLVAFTPLDGKIKELLAPLAPLDDPIENSAVLIALGERIPSCYGLQYWTIDPGDTNNRKRVTQSLVESVIAVDFISAQRGLDDTTERERDTIGHVLEFLFQAASDSSTAAGRKSLADDIRSAVSQVEATLGGDFKKRLEQLLPAFAGLGYPGLSDPGIETITTLDVKKLLTNHTKIRYRGPNGVSLPETYNGLGTRNLILMLLRLYEFYRRQSDSQAPVHLVFLEEPEAHLHPQMQEVLLRQLHTLRTAFHPPNEQPVEPWLPQFIISTHSAHVTNQAEFEWLRYFLTVAAPETGYRKTIVKDLRSRATRSWDDEKKFLQQYLELTGCNLFFADKVILIEGTAERILLPAMIRKIDSEAPVGQGLSSQYVAVLEVGGAYAHKFIPLLQFLDMKSLIITDIDATSGPSNKASIVSQGDATSNACIKHWFEGEDTSIRALLQRGEVDKVRGCLRIAYQIAEDSVGACGRTLEDALLLANTPNSAEISIQELEERAKEQASESKKSAFALRYALEIPGWRVPKYIREGLLWLRAGGTGDSQLEELSLDKLSEDAVTVLEAVTRTTDGR